MKKERNTQAEVQPDLLIPEANAANDQLTVDFANTGKPVNPSMFGYILTPNYDVPDSRMTLLGPLLNRETFPAQNFQAVGDGNVAQYAYEESIMARSLEAYKRATGNGLKWYFLLGFHPSWTAPKNNPWGGAPVNMAWFKQYVKDMLQFYKDNGCRIDFANLVNESWSGTQETYLNLWQALREVFPEDIPAVGPSYPTFNDCPDMWLPYASANQLTIEGPSWHDLWNSTSYAPLDTLVDWSSRTRTLQKQYPETNGKYVIWEENNSSTTDPAMWARDMVGVIRAGVTQTIKGCIQNYNWNGMSDLLQTNKTQPNPAIRTSMWWVYYMFSQLSGQYIDVSTGETVTDFSATACKDNDESKIILVKSGTAGSVTVNLINQPYAGQEIRIDMYKITETENEGLAFQRSITPVPANHISFTVNKMGANECWWLTLNKIASAPSFFHPKTPDDGEVVTETPTFTWAAAQGATSYTIKISTNQDLSSPIIHQPHITATSYKAPTALKIGGRYYWSVTAINSSGIRPVSHSVIYSFLVEAKTDLPGQFGPYLPSTNFTNESTTPKFMWSKAFNATSYRLVVSTSPDLKSPVIDVANITNLMDTPQFGPATAGYYQPDTPLANNTTYYWMVYAVNSNGERPMNGPVQYFTTRAAGEGPTGFSLLAPVNGMTGVSTRAVLSWEQSKNAFFYKLEVSPNSDLSNPIIVRDRMIYHKYTVEPNLLAPNTTYFWRVTAYTKDLTYEMEALNNNFLFTTEAVPSSPLLYAVKAGDGRVKLWFQLSNGVTSYKIKYGTASGDYTDTICEVKGSPYEVTGLTNGTEYYFAIVAVNESGDSSIWNERTATPG
jgi:hypothetical protein